MTYILRTIDFETTGLPENGEQSVIESAYVDIGADNLEYIKEQQCIVKPSTSIDIMAQAVHHISQDICDNYGHDWELEVKPDLTSCKEADVLIYVAHNADFEKAFFNPKGSIWIDTYKVALKLYPDAPSHSNQVLKYYLGIEDMAIHHPPHRALPDCRVTVEILKRMREHITFNEMVKISKEPPYLTRIGFGKHKGERFEDLPQDYLGWLSKQADMDEGVKVAVNRVMVV